MAVKDDIKDILWVDDEIDQLQSHIIFLEGKGYRVAKAANGDDAVLLVSKNEYDLVLLDEQMPGKDGLTTLEEIKEKKPGLPVIMVTKSEEERLMNEAIGEKIDDYLTKPVNPSQILSAAKRILETKKIRSGHLTQKYIADFNQLRSSLSTQMSWNDWIEAHRRLSEWELELDNFRDLGLEQTHKGQKKEFNLEFSKYVEKNYPLWVKSASGGDAPLLSTDVVKKFLAPHLVAGKQTVFIVIDCMRLDQWLTLESILHEYFTVERAQYFSILPTATPFSRNAIFSGLFPESFPQLDPDLWKPGHDDEFSRNRKERQYLDAQLARLGIRLKGEAKYVKVLDPDEAASVAKKIGAYASTPLLSIVYNFVDMLTHGRAESEILQELAPTESAFRSVMKSWFLHSSLFDVLKYLARQDGVVVITTDHGSIQAMRGSLVHGKRDTSSSLRYKYGDNLNCDTRQAVLLKDPKTYRLPSFTIATTYVLAKEDYYFLYPTNFNEYQQKYQNSFQHGGISMDEMILPVATLKPKK